MLVLSHINCVVWLLFFVFNGSVGFGQHSLASNITLLRANEVDEIFEGNDDKYKALTVSSDIVIQRFVLASTEMKNVAGN
jgi:hypothetical protein